MANVMTKFHEIANKATTLCDLMVGREKLETEEVQGKEWTIVAFDFAPKFDRNTGAPVMLDNGEQDVFGVVVFSEMPDRYYSVGTVFTKVCKAWAEEYDGDVELASRELEVVGGVRVRFKMSKTKVSKNNIVTVEIL